MEESLLLFTASSAQVVGVFCWIVFVEVALQFEPVMGDFEGDEFIFGGEN